MTLVHLVRHGRATAGWDTDPDPGIDALGHRQAEEAASNLEELLSGGTIAPHERSARPAGVDPGPPIADGVEVVTSPLRRCRETAAVFAGRAGTPVGTVAAVAEIPSPTSVAMADRVDWLRTAMAGTWSALGPRYARYREGVVDFVRSRRVTTVVFSHFVAINAVIGSCLDDDRLVIRRLDNGSITTVRVAPGVVELVRGGAEADTLIR